METNLNILEKKAIDAAIKNNWESALKLNLLILEKNPDNLNAKIRLGKAQIQNMQFKEAINTFNEVLKKDPINQIAIKNLNTAKMGKISQNIIQPNKLIIEPGTTTEFLIEYNSNIPFEIGQSLDIELNKDQLNLFFNKSLFTNITNIELFKIISNAIKSNIIIECSVLKIKGNKITILFSSDKPIFKADKQSVKPYFKKGTIDDEELEIEYGTESLDVE